jgi:hypothetical protein
VGEHRASLALPPPSAAPTDSTYSMYVCNSAVIREILFARDKFCRAQPRINVCIYVCMQWWVGSSWVTSSFFSFLLLLLLFPFLLALSAALVVLCSDPGALTSVASVTLPPLHTVPTHHQLASRYPAWGPLAVPPASLYPLGNFIRSSELVPQSRERSISRGIRTKGPYAICIRKWQISLLPDSEQKTSPSPASYLLGMIIANYVGKYVCMYIILHCDGNSCPHLVKVSRTQVAIRPTILLPRPLLGLLVTRSH